MASCSGLSDRLQLSGQVADFAGADGQRRSLESMRGYAPIFARIAILQTIQNCRQLGHEQSDDLALKLGAVQGVLRQMAPVENDRD